MRVFITGGTGYVGAHIVRELRALGDEVVVLTRDKQKSVAIQDKLGATLVEGSLESPDSYQATLENCDACIHNAILWDEEPTELQLKDPRASIELFEAAANAGVKQFIYTSSVAVHRPFKMSMSEADKLNPTDMYGATKAATEVLLTALSYQHEMRFNIIRPGPVIGRPALDGIAYNCDRRFIEFANLAAQNAAITVRRGDARQFIDVNDLAKAFRAVLQGKLNRETFIAVSRNMTSWEDIARAVIKNEASTSRVILGDAADPHSFNVDKIEELLGLAFDSTDAMSDHIRHLRSRV